MRDYDKMSKLLERVVHKYNQLENRKRTYGTQQLLSRAEIHTVAAVGDHPGVNVTTLARLLGITKGAASQMIYKLVDKEIVEKRVSPDSDTEVTINLTANGKIIYENHREYHRRNNAEIFKELANVPDEAYDHMLLMIEQFDIVMDQKLNHKE